MGNNFEAWAAQHGVPETTEPGAKLMSPITTIPYRPLPLTEFEQLTQECQKLYLTMLLERLGFGPQLAADMLGVTKEAFLSRTEALGVDWSTARLRTRNAKISAEREDFLRGYVFPKPIQEDLPTPPRSGAEPRTGAAAGAGKEEAQADRQAAAFQAGSRRTDRRRDPAPVDLRRGHGRRRRQRHDPRAGRRGGSVRCQ